MKHIEGFLAQYEGNTLDAYSRDLEQFSDWVQDEEINNATMVYFVRHLKREGYKPIIIARKLAVVRSYFAWLVREGIVDENPTQGIEMPEPEGPEPLSDEVIQEILNAPDNTAKGLRDRAMLELLVTTGMKSSELVELDTDDVSLSDRAVRVNGRTLPLMDSTVYALRRYLEHARPLYQPEDNTLFLGRPSKRLSQQGLWVAVSNYAEDIGEEDVNPRRLRQTFALRMLDEGVELEELRELMGHIELGSTRRYAR